jgi:hypothetical protein
MKGRGNLEDLSGDERKILKLVSSKQDWREWTRFKRLRTGNGGGLLLVR